MSHQLPAAVPCVWEGGCRATTRDSSHYCHHHRRFSGVSASQVYSDQVARNGLRLPSTLVLSQVQPNWFQKSYNRGIKGIYNYPRVQVEQNDGGFSYIRIHNFIVDLDTESTAFWDDRTVRLPYSNSDVSLSMDNNDLYVEPLGGELSFNMMRNASMASKYQWMTHHAHVYGFFEGSAEEYDDEAEAIAQLNLAPRGTLTIMNPSRSESNDDPEMFRFVSREQDVKIAGTLDRNYPSYTQDGELTIRYRVADIMSTPPVEDLSPEHYEMMTSLESVRNTIAQYCVKDSEEDRIYLPLGWIDAPTPSFLS